MKRNLEILLACAAMGLAPLAAAESSSMMVRVRAVTLDMSNRSEAIPALAVPGDAIQVSNKLIPEVDFTYFFTRNLAAELILTYPQKHDVNVTGSAVGSFRAGSFKHLPPTLTLQYHFLPEGQYRPYVGAGVNYTKISAVSLAVPGVTPLQLENDSWGGALQAGIDVKLTDTMYLNFDIKKIYIRSDLMNGAGAKVSHLKLDPLAIGIGLGWRF